MPAGRPASAAVSAAVCINIPALQDMPARRIPFYALEEKWGGSPFINHTLAAVPFATSWWGK